jgi:glutathionylspermidine synthase
MVQNGARLMKNQAIAYYHSLLNDQSAAETYGLMASLSKERKLFFGDRPLCTVLRPHFYTEEQFQYLKNETEVILGAFEKAHRACMKDRKMRQQFHLHDWEEEIMAVQGSEQVPWTTSRLDSFYSLDHDTLQFIEYNAETPAGMAYEDVLAETFLDLPVMKQFQQKYPVRPLPVRGRLLDALVQTYGDWLGRRPEKPPQIAIVDWDDVPTRNEHRLCKEWFESKGLQSILSDPRNLEYKGGNLWDGNFRIDLIYKRVLAQELYERMGAANPIFQAIRDHAVCMANSFQALLLYKKSSLAFLSDETNHHLFNSREIEAILIHIPWTRVVGDRTTEFRGKPASMLEIISKHKQDLVLKPNDAYGGKGVVLGWDASDEEWNQALQTALIEPYVVQEKVNVASEDFPTFPDNRLQMQKLYVDADPFIFMGKTVGGCLTRLSSAALLNVTAGHGSAVPSFVLSNR